jgi:hypothetical protein
MILADAVALEVSFGAVVVLGLIVGACIVAGFTVAGLLIRGSLTGISAKLGEHDKLINRTNTLIQIMAARQGACGPVAPED